MWFIGVEVEQETSAPPPKKNPGSALVRWTLNLNRSYKKVKTKNRLEEVLFWLFFFSCFVQFSDFNVSDFSTLFFFSTCHALKTWFELSRVESYRNDLTGSKNYFELAGGLSSSRRFDLPTGKREWFTVLNYFGCFEWSSYLTLDYLHSKCRRRSLLQLIQLNYQLLLVFLTGAAAPWVT